MKMKWNIILLAALVLMAQPVLCQEWPVPPDQSALLNPSDYSLENVQKGKEIYTRNCQSCHGDPGKNNPLALDPIPVDIASERMHANSEGDMFYKITAGRGVMPPFEASLSEDDRWKLINFIMNYKPGGTQLLVDAPPVKAKLLASVNEEKSSVEILAELDGPGRVGLVNAPVIVSAKKTFGNIELGRSITNGNGRTEFLIPEDVIGDEEGYVSIVVTLGDGYEAKEVALEKARVGQLKVVPTLIRSEVLWSTNENVQTWLLLSYIVSAGGAWLVIGYIIFQIIKIKRYSNST
jgi:mono/diheme cytochrome c family protein